MKGKSRQKTLDKGRITIFLTSYLIEKKRINNSLPILVELRGIFLNIATQCVICFFNHLYNKCTY